MVDLKRCNYITGDKFSLSFGLSKIIEFLENCGKTPILIHNPELSSLKYFINSSKIEFTNIVDFQNAIDNSSNLFRVDLIILDLWHLNQIGDILLFKEAINKLNIDYIIISKKCHYKSSDDIRMYELSRVDDEKSFHSEYKISEKITGWSSTLANLAISYIRDKKIDDIFE